MRLFKYLITSILIAATLFVTGIGSPAINITSRNNYLSLSVSNLTVEAASEDMSVQSQSLGYTTVEPTSWGYQYVLGNGDIVEVGDSTTPDFKAHIKTIRWNGICNFSLWWGGSTFTPSLDGEVISFEFNNSTTVSIYPVEPCDRLPEGGIEYDIQLSRKPAKPEVTLQTDWTGITWEKILPLDEEYDEARCIEDFGSQGSPYTITQTDIIGSDLETYKHIEEYEVNSYLGEATNAYVVSSGDLGGGVTYNRPSRSYLYVHRGQMTDALNDTAWVEDINLDEQTREFTFTLPSVWLRNAEYPVSQLCGVDPAYTEEMASAQDITGSMSDGTWTACDMADFGLSNTECVLEMILENQQKGAENLIGVRETSSGLSRYVNIHECEPDGGGGGDTHCRMFVQAGASGDFEAYSEDVSDTYFYIVDYWENTSFTENWDTCGSGTYDTWEDNWNLDVVASRVNHIIIENTTEASLYGGIRETGSSIDRRILMHEAEDGGSSYIDFLFMADADGEGEHYRDSSDIQLWEAGCFGSEMDFVELWQAIAVTTPDSWSVEDFTAYLDEDGRVVDMMLLNADDDDPALLGVRDGDDTSTARYLYEHESEGAGGAEYSGFCMSASTNASGEVKIWKGAYSNAFPYLTGYFKPSGGFNISNSPSSENLGVVADSSTYYAYGSAPSNPVQDGECTFTITNNGDQCDIDMKITDFTGGTSWNIVSGSPSTNEVRVTAYYSGQNPASGLVLANTDAEFYDALSTSIKWDFKFETGALTDEPNEHSATLTLTAVAED